MFTVTVGVTAGTTMVGAAVITIGAGVAAITTMVGAAVITLGAGVAAGTTMVGVAVGTTGAGTAGMAIIGAIALTWATAIMAMVTLMVLDEETMEEILLEIMETAITIQVELVKAIETVT